jgi:chitodextrinase
VKRVLGNRAVSGSSWAVICALCLSFVVTGCKSASYAPPPDTIAPTAPASLTVTVVSDTQINLSWMAATDNVGVTGYMVERCTGAACSNFAQVSTPVGTTFSDMGLAASTSYSYRVRATDAAGTLSAYSSTVSASTPAPPDTTPPTAPTNLTATAASASQVNLAWTASTDNLGVTGYRVERCQGAGCSNFSQISAPTATIFNDTGLTASTSYFYRVRATDAAGNVSAYSSTASASTPAPPDTTPPTAPTNLAATAGSASQINLAWTASTDNVGVTGYRVERCQGAGCSNFAQISAPTATIVNDTGLTASTSYSYRVRATDAAGNVSAYSSTASASTPAPPDTTPPTAPANLAATAASASQINLAWTASTDNVGVTGYRVERCQGPACSNFLQVSAPTATIVSDTGLTASTSYSYRVRATDAAGNLSAYSNTASVNTPAPPDTTPPTAPTNLTASAATDTRINLSWTASTDNVGVTGYMVERCQGAACSNFAQISAPTATVFNDTGLTPSTSYSYRVRATDAAGNLSAYSNLASASTPAPPDTTPPTAPANLAATAASASQINLAWTASTDNVGVTGYMVERCTGAACANFAQIATPTATTFSDTGLTASTSYSYRVRATDAAGNLSAYSNTASASTPAPPDTTPPTAPANLAATAASASQINLAWTASTDNVGVTGYRVERCQGPACSNFLQVSAPTATIVSDTGLTASTSYSYRVRATDAAGNLSAYSNTASVNTPAPPDTTPPTAPTNLTASAATDTRINLSWTASTDNVGVTGYMVERCQGAACSNFAQISAPTATVFNDTGLTASTSYSYRVRATDAAGNLSSYSGTGTASTAAGPISVAITPVRGGATFSQSLNFTANLQNDISAAGVTWTASGGTFSSQGNTAATFVAPNAVGNVTITATSVADATKSASAIFAVTDLTGVTTYHNDLARDGANMHEFALTTSSVKTATFGKLFSCSVDGAIYAQPLWVANLIIGTTVHNVIVVATQHDSVYAFDADSNANPCVPLWHANLIDTAHGGTAGEGSVPSSSGGLVGAGFGDITPETGVTGTPVIDPGTNTLYVVSKSAIASPLSFFQRLHALNLTNGNEKTGSPVAIDNSISVSGTGDGMVSGKVAFDPRNEHQRPGLAVVNGVVYIAWASHEDRDPYHGWIIGYNATTLAQVPGAVFNTTPNRVGTVSYSRGGIWMGGGAPAADSSGNLYFLTGNGTFDAATGGSNYGDSTMKLSTTAGLSVADWFTPADQASLDGADTDHGSGGAAILVDQPTSPVQHLVIGGGKEGNLFLLNRDAMGNYGGSTTPANSRAIQIFSVGNGIFSTSAFWNNSLYIAPAGGPLQAYPFITTTGQFNPGSATSAAVSFGFPGATPSISSSGASANGIVWATDSSKYCTPQSPGCGPAVLHAFDATKLSTELWNSSQATSDNAGFAVKFTVPTVANGKVYIGTRGNDTGMGTSSILGELDVYGLKPN